MKTFTRVIAMVLVILLTISVMPVDSLSAFAATTTNSTENSVKADIKRLGGANRYETALKIAKDGWQKAENVIVVSAQSYADALAGVPLAYALDAPILLAGDQIVSQVKEIKAKNIYILGGTYAVSDTYENAFKQNGYSVKRIYGQTRYETAAAIAKELAKISGKPKAVFIASGVNFPDALSASSAAAIMECPIFYSPADGVLDAGTIKTIKETKAKYAYILGGTGAVGDKVNDSLDKTKVTRINRLGGDDRYATSLIINEFFDKKFSSDDIAFATGKNFPDALAGGVFAAKKGVPVLLTDNTTVDCDLKDYITDKDPAIAYVFGGDSVVSDEIVKKHLPGGEDVANVTVTFNANGENVQGLPSVQNVTTGSLATEPDDPTREGYTFDGWYTEANCENKFNFTSKFTKDITLYAKWNKNAINDDPKSPSADKNVPVEIAELFGFEPNEYDTDGDGLSNYDEIYVVGTDPTLTDTDADGIIDANDDSDGDLLENIREIELGTDPLKSDSDFDDISDYEEVNKYGTDPYKDDTDEDGLNDGDELVLGLNPLIKCTDGKTIDSERVFNQRLNNENISGELLDEDNNAIPSLTVKASGNINKTIFIEETSSHVFSDSRAIVGEAIDINGASFDEGTLSFNLADADVSYITTEDTGETFPTLLICKYNSDGETEYLDTEYNAGVLSSHIDCSGTYFVLNIKNLFDELGLSLPTVSDISTLSDPEPAMFMGLDGEESAEKNSSNGDAQVSMFSVDDKSDTVAASTDTVKLTTASSGVMAQADIVFIVDTTGSMGDEISNVKNNISYFVDALNEKGISVALALIDYEDITVDGYDSTRIHKNGSSNWFYNIDDYKTAISNLSLGDGGDTAECAVDALETARLLDMRASAGKIFILVTDAEYKTDNRYGIPSMAAEIELLNNAGVNCSVVSPSYEQSTYYNLYTETNGVWADIYGDFYEELMVLADEIGSGIVGDGCWIYLNGPVPVPVRVDAIPEEGSTVDTDKDGIPDVKELEGANPSGYIDLDKLVSKISRGIITNTNYGKVMMYKYTSNPIEEDSDYDGRLDNEETVSERLSSVFSANMKYETGGTHYDGSVDFSVDYSLLFEDNTKFNQKLAVLASVFALDMYNDGWFEITSGGSGSSKTTNGVSLGNIFGLDGVNIDASKLKSKYAATDSLGNAVDQDDVSEVYIGHRNVSYNGQEREIFFLMVRGTNGTNAEWSSNFDIGADTTGYYSMTGEHPDWQNKQNHKGFDVTATRILKAFDSYVEELINDGTIESDIPRSIFISGHSRGAAIANVLGAHFEDDTKYDSYVYTMAAPYTTTSSHFANYDTIFNIMNNDDLVPYLPLEDWGFRKYGETLNISIKEKYEDSNPFGNTAGTFEALVGKDYDSNASLGMAVNSFKKIADNREDFYTLDTTSGDGVITEGLLHVSDDAYNNLLDMLKAGKMDKFCEIRKKPQIVGYSIEVKYCPAYVAQNMANLAGTVDRYDVFDWIGIDLKGVYATARRDFALASGLIPVAGSITGGMTCPHIPGAYYLITTNTPYEKYK